MTRPIVLGSVIYGTMGLNVWANSVVATTILKFMTWVMTARSLSSINSLCHLSSATLALTS